MKIHICFNDTNNFMGGGNQFLKAIKKFFIEKNNFVSVEGQAGIILFNSHRNIDKVIDAKLRFPQKIFVHRIDGPMSLYNKFPDNRDLVCNYANSVIADATVFQSVWSRKQNLRLGLKEPVFSKTIMNAPDPEIFNNKQKDSFTDKRKIRVVANSWSSNWKKGFHDYLWLDENLDFNRYKITFIGNSPCKFKNILHIQPLPSKELAKRLKLHDIFITASQKDTCSNSLIEAMHCGLPAIALNDGGNPEIVGNGGELFEHAEEIPALFEKCVNNYQHYQNSINLPVIDEIGQQYLDFMQLIYHKVQCGEHTPKLPSASQVKELESLFKQIMPESPNIIKRVFFKAKSVVKKATK